MRNRRLAFIAILAAGALAVCALLRPWSSGPSYQGKSAAQWLKLYRSSSIAEREDARDAFKALGDQAVPYLFSVLTRSRGLSLLRPYEKVWSKLPQPLRKILPRVSAGDTNSEAAKALLSDARPSAKVLMPRLKPWLSSPEHPRHGQALLLLGYVGEGAAEGVPFVIRALQNTNRYHRAFATQSIWKLGAEARAAVPALIGALDDPATRIRAIRALGDIGPAAKDAVPRLEQLLVTTDRLAAATALHKINPQGNYLRLLIDALGDPNLRSAAIQGLSELGQAAMPALDTMLKALKTEGGRDRVGGPQSMTIADALRKISPTNREVILILIEKLKDVERPDRQDTAAVPLARSAYGFGAVSTKSDRLNIASRLVWFDPAEPHGLNVLIETLRSDPEPARRDFAAYTLRQAGPGAAAAIPALKAALHDKDETVRRAAASALRRMESPGAK